MLSGRESSQKACPEIKQMTQIRSGRGSLLLTEPTTSFLFLLCSSAVMMHGPNLRHLLNLWAKTS
jgi:hypothetical protein